MSHQKGFVVVANLPNSAAPSSNAECRGCWGIVGPTGSDSPGIKSTGKEGKISHKNASKAAVGLSE